MLVALALVLAPVLTPVAHTTGCGVGLRTYPHLIHSEEAEHPVVRTHSSPPAGHSSWHPAWEPLEALPCVIGLSQPQVKLHGFSFLLCHQHLNHCNSGFHLSFCLVTLVCPDREDQGSSSTPTPAHRVKGISSPLLKGKTKQTNDNSKDSKGAAPISTPG